MEHLMSTYFLPKGELTWWASDAGGTRSEYIVRIFHFTASRGLNYPDSIIIYN